MCRSLHGQSSSWQRDRSTSMYVHTCDQTDNDTFTSIWWVPAVWEDKEALPCMRRYSWWVPAIMGRNHFFRIIRRHFLVYEDVAGGSQLSGGVNFFSRNKEALASVRAMDHVIPYCQPLHVHPSSDDGCRLLTMLTTPRREHQRGGRRRGLGRERPKAGEDTSVDAHAEGSTRVDWFGCGVRLPSPENNRRCG
jgi:hypothetical protein